MKTSSRRAVSLSNWDQVTFVTRSVVVAGRSLNSAAARVNKKYSLGSRGAWILTLILNGRVAHPHEIARFFETGRNIITRELSCLATARLIECEKSRRDRRLTKVRLTRTGAKAAQSVRSELARLVNQGLSHYSRAEILLCTRMLHDLTLAENGGGRT